MSTAEETLFYILSLLDQGTTLVNPNNISGQIVRASGRDVVEVDTQLIREGLSEKLQG